MANSYTDQAQGVAAGRLRAWVLGLVGSAGLMLLAGALLAATISGIARPWTGPAFVLAMGLALVVGLSKTSSA